MTTDYSTKQYGYEQPLLAVVVPLTVISLIVVFYATGRPNGSLWVPIAGVAIILALLFMPLSMQVTAEQVRVRLAWVYHRDVTLQDVASVEAREYRALRQFGGWGLRYGSGGDRAYTIKGNRAAVITLHDGRSFYLGARDPEALADAIRVRVSP